MSETNTTVLTRAQADELISFLLSSAEITLKEPIHYGPLRLVDAVSRLVGFMEDNGAVVDGEQTGNDIRRRGHDTQRRHGKDDYSKPFHHRTSSRRDKSCREK